MRAVNDSRYVIRIIANRTRNTLVGSHVEIADNFLNRLVGLLGRDGLDTGCGLLIQPSSGIHTFGMRFPIDVVALDRRFQVVSARRAVRPWRISGLSWRTRAVLELPAGHLDQCSIMPGDQLEILELTS
jgi:uncharacterized membrane protein (UPF0127 family)